MEQFFAHGHNSPYYVKMKSALEAMDTEICSVVSSEHSILNETALHLHKSGGKHLRPGFVFLGGCFGAYNQEKLMPLAMSLEITHMATLVHDDVVDSAALRRNKPTVKALWGNRVSVYTGNYLLAKSMSLVSIYNDSKLNNTLADVALEMCSGEISQLSSKVQQTKSIDSYLKHIKQKTALLLSASCELGAYFCGAPQEITQPLKLFGEYLGMAFQITDDILDYSPNAKKFGKVLGGDIRQNAITLPLLYAIEQSKNPTQLEELFNKTEKSEKDVTKIISLVNKAGGMESAQLKAKEYTQLSKHCIEKLPNSEIRTCFLEIADFVLKRKF
ncbi:MAG: polyprenyl synthetase family protein [Clostridiales bacterium]